MTRSVEIPEAGETAAFEALRAHEDASYWNSCACHCGATFETIELLHRHIATSVVAAALPYLAPAEVVIDHRPGETCSVAAEVDPETGFARAPAGDGGLREALEQALESPVELWHENSFRVRALPETVLRELLAAHPAAPAPVVGVCEHPSDVFGPCTLATGA